MGQRMPRWERLPIHIEIGRDQQLQRDNANKSEQNRERVHVLHELSLHTRLAQHCYSDPIHFVILLRHSCKPALVIKTRKGPDMRSGTGGDGRKSMLMPVQG